MHSIVLQMANKVEARNDSINDRILLLKQTAARNASSIEMVGMEVRTLAKLLQPMNMGFAARATGNLIFATTVLPLL